MKKYLLFSIICLIVTSYKSFAIDANLTQIDSLKLALNNAKTDKGKIEPLKILAKKYIYLSPEKAINYCKIGLEIAAKLNSEADKAYFLNQIGVSNMITGQLIFAYENLTEALRIREKLQNKEDIGSSLNNIAVYYLMYQNNLPLALETYEKNISLYREIGNQQGMITSLSNIAIIYTMQNELDKAFATAQKALELAEELGEKNGISVNLNNLANIYFKKNNLNEALVYFNRALPIAMEMKNTEEIISSYKGLGLINRRLGKFKDALFNFDRAKEYSESINYLLNIKDVNYEIYGTYKQLGDAKNALVYFESYNKLKDSLDKFENDKKLNKLQAIYELDKKKKEIEILDKDNKLIDAENKQKKIANYFLLTVCAIVIAIGYHFKVTSNKRKSELEEKEKNRIELEKYADELEKTNRSKDKMFSIIAHDLRGPIGSFQSALDMILTKPEIAQSPDFPKWLISMNEASKSTFMLLENLLLWAKLSRNELPYSPETIEIQKLVKDCVSHVNSSADLKNILIKTHIEDDSLVYGDNVMTKSIIRNLIVNSIKFSKSGTKIHIYVDKRNGSYLFTVKDSGIGMTEEKVKNLFAGKDFKPTFGTKNEKGSGLGLLLCKAFVEKSAGRIWVESEEGSGTSVFFTLPAA